MFGWEQFIQFADELFKDSNFKNEEALYRTIVIIAYYGIFKQVQDCLQGLEKEELIKLPNESKKGKKLGSHDKFIYFLREHTKTEVKKFGKDLYELKGKRTDANYELDIEINKEESEEVLIQAKKLNKDWNEKIKKAIIDSLNIQKHFPPSC